MTLIAERAKHYLPIIKLLARNAVSEFRRKLRTMFKKSHIKPEFQPLLDKFPEFFLELSDTAKHYDGDCNLRYGFECEGGWVNILENHFEKIRNLLAEANKSGIECNYKACILKEKFGTCEDQGDFKSNDKEMVLKYWKLSDELRSDSSKTCEITGRAGKTLKNGRGWVKTLCLEEAERLEYR